MEFNQGTYRQLTSHNKLLITRQVNPEIGKTRINIDDELWLAVEYYSNIEEVGKSYIKSLGITRKDKIEKVFKDFQAYIRQAKSFYDLAIKTPNRSSSLLYYYSFLNIIKAGIVIREPNLARKKLMHGISYKTNSNKKFENESISIISGNYMVFSKFYELYFKEILKIKKINVSKLFGYCSDISIQFDKSSYGEKKIHPAILSIAHNDSNHTSWPIIGIVNAKLIKNYPKKFKNFFDSFEEITLPQQISRELFKLDAQQSSVFTYFQSKQTFNWINNNHTASLDCMSIVQDVFKNLYQTNFLIDEDPNFFINLPYLINNQTPMNEMMAIYLIMYYLSELVRYKPYYLEKLLNKKEAWMIDSFIISCPSSFLRAALSWVMSKDYIYSKT